MWCKEKGVAEIKKSEKHYILMALSFIKFRCEHNHSVNIFTGDRGFHTTVRWSFIQEHVLKGIL